MPAEGGNAIQVTRHGGEAAFESPDSRFIYYSRGAKPACGGFRWTAEESSTCSTPVLFLNVLVTPDAIFFVRGPADGACSIRFFGCKAGVTTFVAPMEAPAAMGLSLPLTGDTSCTPKPNSKVPNLMLVENF
jgi:hypothetical protein